MKSTVLLIHALSPVHAGTGQSIGAIDLPIARNRATEHPYIPGSSIKGSLRDVAVSASSNSDMITKIFGPEATESSDSSGTVAIGDANIVALPVRSIAGTFSWICSPYTLSKFVRDLKDAGATLSLPAINVSLENCIVHTQSQLKITVDNQQKVIFEDLDLQCSAQKDIDSFVESLVCILFPNDNAWQNLFIKKFCIVSDDIFTFLAKNGTDVVTRVRISHESKVVEKGALWTEENLPAESILYSNLVTMPHAKSGLTDENIVEYMKKLIVHPVQLGGKATIGRGRCALRLGV